jgi:hypothetical protein
MSTISKPQLRNLFRLLREAGLTGRRHALIYEVTGERTESSKELTIEEYNKLKNDLNVIIQKEDKADKMRKKIISMAREMRWEIISEGKTKADIKRINDWCLKFGYLHKSLNQYTEAELPKLVTQFENVYISFIKSI